MTFYEAIVPVCLELYAKGLIELSEVRDWGFDYTQEDPQVIEEIIEDRTGHRKYDWGMFCAESKKAAAIIKNSPLYEELK